MKLASPRAAARTGRPTGPPDAFRRDQRENLSVAIENKAHFQLGKFRLGKFQAIHTHTQRDFLEIQSELLN